MLLRAEPRFIDGELGGGPDAGMSIFADTTRDAAKPGERHLNETGYRLLAEKVATRLLRDGALALRPRTLADLLRQCSRRKSSHARTGRGEHHGSKVSRTSVSRPIS
jgi:hypothetical protein